MKLLAQELPAPNNSPSTIEEAPAPGKDPLIARGLQTEQYLGIIALAIALVAVVGFVSRPSAGLGRFCDYFSFINS